jgi:hypothetical protein
MTPRFIWWGPRSIGRLRFRRKRPALRPLSVRPGSAKIPCKLGAGGGQLHSACQVSMHVKVQDRSQSRTGFPGDLISFTLYEFV